MKFRKIAFLGDSITEGAFAGSDEAIYHQVVARELGIECLNYGKSGARIAKQSERHTDYDAYDFQTRMVTIDKDCDFVFVFGGVNDYGHGDAEIGSFDSLDPYTFIGGLRNVAKYLVDTFGKDRVCFILPTHCCNEDNPYGEFGKAKPRPYYPLRDYVEAEIKVLNDLGVEFLDLRGLWDVPESYAQNDILYDGLHPNKNGHRLLGEAIIAYLKKREGER